MPARTWLCCEGKDRQQHVHARAHTQYVRAYAHTRTHVPSLCPVDDNPQGKDLSRQAATVIFPTDLPSEEDPATREMYLRSHADYMPGARLMSRIWQAFACS